MDSKVMNVFLSSTARDLKQYRKAVYEVISKMINVKCIRMEDFGAIDANAIEVSLKMLSRCSVMIGIVGHNYGTIVKEKNKSITNLEYEFAKQNNIGLLMFVASDEFLIPANLRESDHLHEKQVNFRNEILQDKVVTIFSNIDDLIKNVGVSLANHIQSGANIDAPKGQYLIMVDRKNSTSEYIEYLNRGKWYFPVDYGDPYLKKITIVEQSSLKTYTYDFTKGDIPEGAKTFYENSPIGEWGKGIIYGRSDY